MLTSQIQLFAEAMSRNRFRDILKNLHFANNTKMSADDTSANVRPLINHLNERCIKLLPADVEHVDVDESMIPYYSHHGCKQRIQGKPIRYGFKFWSLNASDGYLISTEPYQGKGTMLSHGEFGLGSSVVLTFADWLSCVSSSTNSNEGSGTAQHCRCVDVSHTVFTVHCPTSETWQCK